VIRILSSKRAETLDTYKKEPTWLEYNTTFKGGFSEISPHFREFALFDSQKGKEV
jgi:hypothetical protein